MARERGRRRRDLEPGRRGHPVERRCVARFTRKRRSGWRSPALRVCAGGPRRLGDRAAHARHRDAGALRRDAPDPRRSVAGRAPAEARRRERGERLVVAARGLRAVPGRSAPRAAPREPRVRVGTAQRRRSGSRRGGRDRGRRGRRRRGHAVDRRASRRAARAGDRHSPGLRGARLEQRGSAC